MKLYLSNSYDFVLSTSQPFTKSRHYLLHDHEYLVCIRYTINTIFTNKTTIQKIKYISLTTPDDHYGLE